MTSPTATERCATCYGEGVQFLDVGPQTCPDCCGLGDLPSASVLRERRLRELEELYEGRQHEGEAWRHVRWLVGEVRRSQHALLQILAASQDAENDDPVLKKIRFLANDVLGLYRPRSLDESEDGTRA